MRRTDIGMVYNPASDWAIVWCKYSSKSPAQTRYIDTWKSSSSMRPAAHSISPAQACKPLSNYLAHLQSPRAASHNNTYSHIYRYTSTM